MHTSASEGSITTASATSNLGTAVHSWRMWCRLCAKEDAQGNINVFFKGEQHTTSAINGDLSLVTAIEKFFWINIDVDDMLPKMLCTECFSLVTSLVNFSERIEKVQQMFNTLCDSSISELDLHAVRLKHDLLEEDREHVLMQHPLPEVHYFEAKPKIIELEEIMFEGETATASRSDISTNPLEQQPRIKIKIKKEKNIEEQSRSDDNDINYFEDEDPFNGKFSYERDADGDDETDRLLEKELDTKTRRNDLTKNKLNAQEILKEDLLPLKQSNEDNPKKRRCFRKQNHQRVVGEGSKNFDEDSKLENDTKKKVSLIPCNECPRKFKRIQQFRQHMKLTHNKEIPASQLTCSSCPRIFTTNYELNKHEKAHLPLELKRVFSCSYCDKKFTSNHMAQIHVKNVHRNERPFICEECGVRKGTSSTLKEHMLTHTDYAPFECDVCKKKFKNKFRLKNHKEIHDPNKHICAECGLQLNSRTTLNRHLLVHSDKMQHKCDYCGRAFKRAKALKAHLILHTGLKPYSCDFCDRTFANGSNCRTHKKKSHPEELAALEASGGGKTYTRNIPKLEALKAVTKTADNLTPVVSKQSGCFAFGKKPKLSPKNLPEKAIRNSYKQNLMVGAIDAPTATQIDLGTLQSHAGLVSGSNNNIPSIPNIDNIYSHIMKHATLAAQNINVIDVAHENDDSNARTKLIKRSQSATSLSYVGIEDEATSDAPLIQQQQHQQQQQLHAQHTQQQSTTPTTVEALTTPTTPVSASSEQFYTQIIKQHEQQQQTHQQQHAILTQQQQDDLSIRSPDSQASHMTNTDDQSNTSAHFYNHIRQNIPGPYI